MVYVVSKSGKPLMPTERYGHVRKLLKFYQRHLPKELKGYCESITGKVEKNGMSVIQISKSLVLDNAIKLKN